VYPGARCNMGGRIFMYQRLASLAVESMNWANKAACARMAVDVVSSTRLLLKFSASRYQEKKEEVWTWEEALTPYGTKLRDAAFETINFQHYRTNIDNLDDRYECSVKRVGKGLKERTCYFMKELIMRSLSGGCSCGIPFTDGIPCHHMVAVVKSSQIEGLTPTNAMPYWWTTECWRNQYPADINVMCAFDMEALRETPEDRAMIYFPPYAAPRKTGRPKIDKKIKSPLEVNKKRKKKERVDDLPAPKKCKHVGKRRGKGGGGKRRSPD
jgi:hypothetical protein